jgi:hypothetical protein
MGRCTAPGSNRLSEFTGSNGCSLDPVRGAILRPMLLRTDPLRIAVFALGLAVVLILGAYAFAATESRPTLGGVVASLAALAIAGSGLLYAWRLGTGGIVD